MEKNIVKITVTPDILTMVQALKEFHEAFDCVINPSPVIIDDATALLRAKLMVSETSETVDAMANQDLLEILDGLTDQLYVVIGAAVSYGLGDILMDAFVLVHKNNMSKLGPNGKPMKDASGKVIKPEGYVPVDLRPLLIIKAMTTKKDPPELTTTDKERKILENTTSKNSCKSCAYTKCKYIGRTLKTCGGYLDNRNYPINQDTDKERKILEDRENPPAPIQKACCGNCAERLKLKGCSRYVKTNNDGCCIDHKFLK